MKAQHVVRSYIEVTVPITPDEVHDFRLTLDEAKKLNRELARAIMDGIEENLA